MISVLQLQSHTAVGILKKPESAKGLSLLTLNVICESVGTAFELNGIFSKEKS